MGEISDRNSGCREEEIAVIFVGHTRSLAFAEVMPPSFLHSKLDIISQLTQRCEYVTSTFRLLEYTLNTSLIKSQDGDSVISSVASNPNGRLLAWDFFKLHWATLRKR